MKKTLTSFLAGATFIVISATAYPLFMGPDLRSPTYQPAVKESAVGQAATGIPRVIIQESETLSSNFACLGEWVKRTQYNLIIRAGEKPAEIIPYLGVVGVPAEKIQELMRASNLEKIVGKALAQEDRCFLFQPLLEDATLSFVHYGECPPQLPVFYYISGKVQSALIQGNGTLLTFQDSLSTPARSWNVALPLGLRINAGEEVKVYSRKGLPPNGGQIEEIDQLSVLKEGEPEFVYKP
ncbi:hypothetical protein HZC32_03110 [Candidatus Woesearchaeota archaeon]|nr:hypothetical protein [Candidatus Woesearchaeota archaeon]